MSKKLYVGNLAYSTNEDTLKRVFEQQGEVLSVNVIMDRDTGRSKGFAFVEMANDNEADAAIDTLNGSELDGRTIKVSESKPQERRPGGGGRGGFGGPRGGGGGGRRY